ncbi:hypothetical protein D9M71_457600 [compost metagenome]
MPAGRRAHRTGAEQPRVFACTFAEHALFKARVLALGAAIEEEIYGADGVTVTLSLATDRLDELQRLLTDLSRGRAVLQRLDD